MQAACLVIVATSWKSDCEIQIVEIRLSELSGLQHAKFNTLFQFNSRIVTKYLAGVYKRHWTTIYVEYMLNYIVRAGDCHMISWLQFGLMSNTGNLSPIENLIGQVLRWIRWSFFNTGHVRNIHIHYIT